MYKLSALKNGLTVVTMDLPHLESVTTMVAVGAGSRYETRPTNGISHFLEHMFFKGSRKYPSAEQIATLVDSVGAINNAATDKEATFYWIKSAAKHVELASDILSSMVKESLLAEEEIEREKGVIIEEIRMYHDNPQAHVWDLYERLQFGDQPIGWWVGGDEETIVKLTRQQVVNYMGSLYSPKNMVLVYVGNLPKNTDGLAERYFSDLPQQKSSAYKQYRAVKQTKPKIDLFYKKTDQVNLVLGVESYDRYSPKRHAAKLLTTILGSGMSSRLFIQVRERRGLAYHVAAILNPYKDTGFLAVYGGFKLEKIEEAIEVIKAELLRIAMEKVGDEELKKAKEIERGRLALKSESTNFLAEYLGINFILDREIETFEEYLKKIDAVTAEEIQEVAKELLQSNRLNLQMISPLKDPTPFEKILNS